jgi:hypothetical protein
MSGRANTPLLSASLQEMPHPLAQTRSYGVYTRYGDEFRLPADTGFTRCRFKAAFAEIHFFSQIELN